MGQSGLSPLLVLVVIICIYVVLGCLMDSLSMILLTIPIFFPIDHGARLLGPLRPTRRSGSAFSR